MLVMVVVNVTVFMVQRIMDVKVLVAVAGQEAHACGHEHETRLSLHPARSQTIFAELEFLRDGI